MGSASSQKLRGATSAAGLTALALVGCGGSGGESVAQHCRAYGRRVARHLVAQLPTGAAQSKRQFVRDNTKICVAQADALRLGSNLSKSEATKLDSHLKSAGAR